MCSILLLPLLSGLLAQIIKFFLQFQERKFKLRNIFMYSGMPSGHAAMVVSLVTIVALKEGVYSPALAVSFILAIIVIRDALGIRRYLGEHSRLLNKLVKDLGDDELINRSYPYLQERIGHTAMEVVVGSIIGFFVSIISYIL